MDEAPRPAMLRLLESTRFTLLVQDADLRSVLLGLGRESPLNVVVAPDVSGRVSADLADVSLLEILDQLVEGRGYRYTVRGSVLRIFRQDRETRTYRLDYPSYTRKALSRVSLAGFAGSSGAVGETEVAAGAGQDASSSEIETEQVGDLWSEVERAVRIIVFGTPDAEVDPEREVAAAEREDSDSSHAERTHSVLPARRVIVSRQSGLVSVTAESHLLDEVDEYLKAVARSQSRQVLIDAQIVEVTLGDDLDFGFDIEGAPDLGKKTAGVFERLIVPGLREATIAQGLSPVLNEGGISIGFARDSIGLILRAIAKQTDVRIVSTPRIATLNNHKALIKVVRNEVFFVANVETILTDGGAASTQTEFTPAIIPVGVNLDVTPQVSEDDEITLHIRPSLSEVVSVQLQPTSDPDLPQNGSLPVVDVRETDSVLRVKDGTTIVLGGLVQSREFEQQRKVPLLSEIPWIGKIFTGTATKELRTELLIFLTPTVLDGPRIARVSEGMRRDFDATDEIARKRSLVRPWWRQPLFESYGAQR